MTDDLDLQMLADIPDPFPGSRTSPANSPARAPAVSSPDRSRVRARRMWAGAAAVLYAAAWPMFVSRRPDLLSAPASVLALGLAVPLVAVVLALIAAVGTGERGLGEPQARLMTLLVASPAAFVALTLLTAPAALTDGFWPRALGCMRVTAVLAAGPVALGVVAFRRGFVVASGWRGAGVGVACGALAAAVMSLVCPIGEAWHLLAGHGAMILFAGLGGAVSGRYLCRA
jgi:hypothetical protein